MSEQTPIPAEALEAAAKVALRRYESEHYVSPDVTWQSFVAEIHEFVEAAAPALLAAGRTAAATRGDDWNRPEPQDLDAIENRWLSMCCVHDVGVPGPCNCPDGDYRQVIADLVSEVRALRGDVVEGETRGRTAAAEDIRTMSINNWTDDAIGVRERAARVAENGADR